MCKGVIADHVAGLHEVADDVGALLDIAADQKKSRADVVTRKNLQQAKGVRVVWAVVVSERELLHPTRKAGECAAVPLAGGRHRLVASGEQGANADQSTESGC